MLRFVRYGDAGAERPGLVDDEGEIRDLSRILGPDPGLPDFAMFEAIAEAEIGRLPVVTGPVRLGPPVDRPGKIVACGLNYADHIAESGLAAGVEPTFYLKPPSSICGPNDDIVLPPGSTHLDWEVELAAVVGRRLAYADRQEAEAAILGYTIMNDVSERHNQFQRGQGQWVKGKGADTFGPLGPWLVPARFVETADLGLWLDVNGVRMQSASTADMIFKVGELVAYASQFMSLQPGDIVSTGSPHGSAMGRNPPNYLKPGDRVRLGIAGLGEQDCLVRALSR